MLYSLSTSHRCLGVRHVDLTYHPPRGDQVFRVLDDHNWVRVHTLAKSDLLMRGFIDHLGCNLSGKYSWHDDELTCSKESTFKIPRAPSHLKMTMRWLWTSSSPLIWLLLRCTILVQIVAASGSSYFCSRNIYDSPVIQDCSHALAALPQADEFYRYYIEQQLQAAPPDSDWESWKDERPISFRRNLVQVPKYWSHGE